MKKLVVFQIIRLIVLVDHSVNIVKEFTNLEKQVIWNFLYRNELDAAFFDHDAAYSDRQNSAKQTISDQILKDYEINRKLMKLLEIVDMKDIKEH